MSRALTTNSRLHHFHGRCYFTDGESNRVCCFALQVAGIRRTPQKSRPMRRPLWCRRRGCLCSPWPRQIRCGTFVITADLTLGVITILTILISAVSIVITPIDTLVHVPSTSSLCLLTIGVAFSMSFLCFSICDGKGHIWNGGRGPPVPSGDNFTQALTECIVRACNACHAFSMWSSIGERLVFVTANRLLS